MISNSPTVADGGTGTTPPATRGTGPWFARMNVGGPALQAPPALPLLAQHPAEQPSF